MISKYQLYKSSFDLTLKIINFFLAKSVDDRLFELIKNTLIDESKDETFNNKIKVGQLSLSQFYSFSIDVYKINSWPIGLVELVVEDLKNNFLILELNIFRNKNERYFQPNSSIAKFASDQNIIDNLIFGFEYIIEKYSDSVVKIENTDFTNKISIGTGFFNHYFDGLKIITNAHVLESAKKLRIFSERNEEFKILKVRKSTKKDIAIIEIENPPSVIPFSFNPQPKILDEIITIGYPSIPMVREAYQIFHKGEVNSLVQDYSGNRLFLISAKTSSGNSGSPVIDSTGRVIGMVTKELFDKGELEATGKLPYYAAISVIEILNEMKQKA